MTRCVTGLYSRRSPSLSTSVLALRVTIPFAGILVWRGSYPLPRQARKPPSLRFEDYRHGLDTPALRG